MEETVPLVEDGQFIDVEAYTKHNEAFHNAIVELANNPTLTDSYARLGVSGLMVSLLGRAGKRVRRSSMIIGPSSMRIERGSLEDATRVISQHNENAKETTRRAIVAAGGEL